MLSCHFEVLLQNKLKSPKDELKMTTDNRIEQLEMKASFQEDNIETLNNEVFDLQRKLQVLTEQMAYLVSKLKESEPDDVGIDQVDMRPPHY